MNEPKIQTDDPPTQGTSPDHNPTGTTPHGVPEGMEDTEAKGHPTSDRQKTETAVPRIENG